MSRRVRAFERVLLPGMAFVIVFVFLVFFMGAVSRGEEAGKGAPEGAATLSPAEQEKLARELYTVMIGTDKGDLETFITLHTRVIKECPDTEKARISVWRLSNLYLYAGERPDYQKIIELMEHLIERYPDSSIIPNAKQRLLHAYEETGNAKKALSMYEEIFEKRPAALEDPKLAAYMLGYAKALAETGNKDKAAVVYNKVLSFQDRTEDFLLDIARSELEKL